MKKTIKLSALLIAFVLLLASCGNTVTGSKTEPQNQPETENTAMNTDYSANSVAQLRKIIPTTPNASLLLKGYYAANDGGGGMFYWDAESTEEPDNGIIFAPNGVEKGRFIRICEENYRNVKWFGAIGGTSDDYPAIQAAIDSLPSTGGTVTFPGGIYNVSKTIQIGNGDGNKNRSEINGITLVGDGGGFGIYGHKEPTVINAYGVMDTLISVNGRISDVTIKGLMLDCGQKVKVGIKVCAANSLTLSGLNIKQFTEIGIHFIPGKGTGNGNGNCRIESVSSLSTLDNIICVSVDGDEGTKTNENFTFIDSRFDIHQGNGSKAMYIAKGNNLSFYRCHFARYNDNSDCLVLDATKCDGNPFGNTFYDCSVGAVKIIEDEDHHIGSHNFLGYGTFDMEEVPDHPMLSGITDGGVPFGMGEK